ncbi:lytic transglycosylase domain-containing protein [Rothia halotolerans]|uniref:lytic transglycosylase domain-containing protein n=1 Tax=Rothia halotolerans TaxID=405770 RepID=UPI001EE13DFB|nr:lytic transglycosylase domain-containing protein [Rothia halotolerans]
MTPPPRLSRPPRTARSLRAARPTARRTTLSAALCGGALLLASCGGLQGGAEREPREGYPSAPTQAEPAARAGVERPSDPTAPMTGLASSAPEGEDDAGNGDGPSPLSRTETPIAELPDPGWAAETAEATGIPLRAVRAYAGAALATAETHPQCGVGWNALAGIGWIESQHGTLSGGEAGEDGVVVPRITGVPLDGGEGVMAVPDTDGGELDGDAVWDRAVGPMQFLPETWAAAGLDGDRDGRADPHQIDDAALTAAAYLCERGGAAAEDDSWTRMVFGYNRSVDYLWDVAEAAEEYAGGGA